MNYKLPDLPYAYDALEPHIDEETMVLHHTKHHNAYVTNLNVAIEKHPELFEKTVEELVANLDTIPEDIRLAVRNHGGGHANHTFFWNIMKKDAPDLASGDLAAAIDKAFGSYDEFVALFKAKAGSVFGSGWGWLVVNADKELEVIATPNQDSPLTQGLVPILGVDVWEHAYYKKFSNLRPDYLNAFFEVVNWPEVERLYTEAVK